MSTHSVRHDRFVNERTQHDIIDDERIVRQRRGLLCPTPAAEALLLEH